MANQKGISIIIIISIIVGILLVAGGIYSLQKTKTPRQQSCSQEAKICPDGTAVSRTGPNCEFAACPAKEKECVVDSDCYPSGFVLEKCGPFYTCGSGKCYEGSHACPKPN